MKPKKKKNIAKRLIHHYKVSLIDQDEHQEKLSFRLNLLNGLLLIAFFTIIIVGSTLLMLFFSPIKSYFIPVEQSKEVQYKKDLLKLNERLLSLEDSLKFQSFYLQHMRAVVTGNIKAKEVDTLLMANQNALNWNDSMLQASPQDSLFRRQIAQEELEALKTKQNETTTALLYSPLKGIVTAGFDVTENHLAIDIAAPEGEGIKSIADGTVLFADWTPDTGFVAIVRHPNDMVSLYKHCSKIYKEVGQEVEKGQIIAAVGNTGELTTGPHLHFELWVQGKAVDPSQYIDF